MSVNGASSYGENNNKQLDYDVIIIGAGVAGFISCTVCVNWD